MVTRYVVIDDEFYVRYSINQVVKQTVPGFICVGEAENGIEGLNLVKQLKPDLILLDIKMPGINGLELCMEIQREKM